MDKTVLISGASFAGLTLAYWLNKFGYKVTLVEISSGIRKGGSPIEIRGEALNIVKEMELLEKIRAKRLTVNLNKRMVNAKNETLFSWNHSEGDDIEIDRDDLLDILEEIIPKNVEFLYQNRIAIIEQSDETVNVTFKNGENRNFDFVFGADGTHSSVRKMIFGNEDNFSVFFGAYFATCETKEIPTNEGTIYNEPGRMAGLFPFRDSTQAIVIFRSPKLNYDYKNQTQQKQILRDNLKNSDWKIPQIVELMLKSENLYFDEICQIKMPSWAINRIALVGDAAYTAGFPTGMGTTLAIQGSATLAKSLYGSRGDYRSAFLNYYESYRPFVDSIQPKIIDGLNFTVPKTQEEIDNRFNK
ncbi:FAD-dependent monooxygenase [Flagellimonas sediminis]|uniref:NAD-binding protein n=1 Tax=Flagellimonas sediminis TaxID=2696468 RepID=A0A6I5L7Z9_9FLAO|nr:FAD-dependent monooxygenase [Allomuricauda sediminis]NDV44900.1 NAD-binding protein [Allomuricauda sediminis]